MANAEIDCSLCNNTSAIAVADGPLGIANLWPSCACVTGKTGLVTKVTISLINIYHSWPSDLHFILRGPDGTAVYVMGKCGDAIAVGPFTNSLLPVGPTITLDDDAASSLPDAGQLVTGTFKPTLYDFQVPFPTPAPQPTLPLTLSEFIGKAPNGTYTLWIVDNGPFNTGGLAGGWSIDIQSA
jgi:hypothetical protein